jgi:hypothetical protein
MTAFKRFTSVLLTFRYGVEEVEEPGMKPRSLRDRTKTLRREVISCTVFEDMKFYKAVSAAAVIRLFFSPLRRKFSLHYGFCLGVYIRYKPGGRTIGRFQH